MNKLEQSYVEAYYRSQGCELLDAYVNNKKKMKYRCSCDNIDYKDWTHFKRGQRCNICKKNKNSEVHKCTEKYIRDYLEKYNCRLNGPYKDYLEKFNFICSCGKEDSKTFPSFKRAPYCGICAAKSSMLDENIVKNIYKQFGCTLLEPYKGSKHKYKFKCKCGREGNKSYEEFCTHPFCKVCGIDKRTQLKRLPNEFVKAFFEEHNCTLLDDYINNHTPMAYICECGEESQIRWNEFRLGGRCYKCGLNKLSEQFRLDTQYVEDFFKQAGCILQTKYEHNHQKLDFICSCGRPSNTVWMIFKESKCCRRCSLEKIANKNRYTIDDVRQMFEEGGCKLLSNIYENQYQLLSYVCECGNYQHKISLTNFLAGHRCGCKYKRGPEHYLWNGLVPISTYLRRKIDDWKQKSRELCNYKCVITGNEVYEVHHLYPFAKIIYELFEIHNFPIYETIGQYDYETELLVIEEEFFKLHDSYGSGVCLSVDLHDEFHSTYGKNNFSPEQFKKFYAEKTGKVFEFPNTTLLKVQ